MNIKQFTQQHRDNWKELEHLTAIIGKSKKNITAKSMKQFYSLYQKASQNLSYSQTNFPNEELTGYLNELVSRAHNVLYKDQTTSMGQFLHFFTTTFVGLILEQWKAIVVAMALFTLGLLGSFFSVIADPLHIYTILPDDMAHSVDPNQLGSGDGGVDSPTMSASIMTNNIQVAFLAFAGGITLGILTVYVMVYNGIIVGALAGLFWTHGKSYDFWAYIVPHGMIELTAIFIAGGAGMLMGYKIFVPGAYSRGFQLKKQAIRSIQLIIGTIPLFIIAGVIEGYITPTAISLEAKYFVAILTIIGLILYILIGKQLFNRQQATKGVDS
ncbi:stage II sporulation protein M [Lederbergia sp. NSJ-179]|uniref:stage II sporulation protein M n=1 Tax=Lederbergia sp. NSJ-179 TaxID=2931402 RepID=UPI001FD0EA3D|nr:stage II sporulation protein M [Lederbergia sp. NSJ-179]MCJ7842005.1 stage II sporulation protein M [Lederbergia sp. NSJ-179]